MLNKKSLKRGLLACVALVAVMALLLCGCNKNGKKNDSDSKKEPSKGAVSVSLVDQATALYGDLLTLCQTLIDGDSKLYTSSEWRVVLGDDVKDMAVDLLESEGIDDADANALVNIADGLTVGVDGGLQGDLLQVMLSVGHTDDKGSLTNVVDMDLIANYRDGAIYMGIPSLLDGYMAGSIDPLDTSAFDELSAAYDELEPILPSEELVGKLLNKYIDVLNDQLSGKETEKTVEANGVKEKLTVSEYKITEKVAVDVALAVLKEVKKDKDIEKWLNDASDFIGVEGAYDDFIFTVEDAIDELESIDDFDAENYLVLTQYLNADDVCVGFDVTAYEKDESEVVHEIEVVHYVMTVSGNTFGCEYVVGGILEAGENIKMVGGGTEKNGVINASFDMSLQGKNLMTMEVIDYSESNGTIRLIPSEEILDMLWDELYLPSAIYSVVSMLDLGLQIEMKSADDEAGELGIYLVDKDEILVGFAVSVELTDKTIKEPSSKDVYTEDEAEEWLSGLDMDKLLSSLRKIGVPEELCDMLESEWDALLSGNQLAA